MDFLYTSPEFPPNYTPFILRLRDAGARLWDLGEADGNEMPEDLRGRWCGPCVPTWTHRRRWNGHYIFRTSTEVELLRLAEAILRRA